MIDIQESNTDLIDSAEFVIKIDEAATINLTEVVAVSEDADDILGIRIFISGGGCSGVQWGMTYADKIEDDDVVQELSTGLKLIMDKHCNATLQDVSIEFNDDKFSFNTANPSGGCGGCGT